MKFVIEENDKNYIDKVNQDLAENQDIPLFINNVGKSYTLEFESVDIAKANAFVLNMMSSDKEKVKEVEDLLGIKIKAISYDKGSSSLNTLKNYLRNFLDQLESV